MPYDRGVFYLEGAGLKDDFAPVERNVHEPDDSLESDRIRASVFWDHRFNETWKARLIAQVDHEDFLSRGARNPNLNGLYLPGTNRYSGNPTVGRSFTVFDGDLTTYYFQPQVEAKWSIGASEQTTVAGFNYIDGTNNNSGQDGADTWPINALDPVYGTAPTPLPVAPATGGLPVGARDFLSRRRTEEHGVFLQHKADLMNDRLHLLGGIRYDWYETKSAYVGNRRIAPLPDLAGYDDENLSYRLGGVYDLNPMLSVFAGYSNAFIPQSGTLRGGGDPDSLEAVSYEAGLKGRFFNDRLAATLSVFHIEQSNILESDPANLSGENFLLPLGDNTVQGVELSFSGQVTDRLDLIGGFAYLDSEISSSGGNDGNAFYNTPEFQASIYARYDLSDLGVEGLSVGSGLVYVDDRPGDNANTFDLPSYIRWDAGLFYSWRNWDFRLTVENVLDETYYIGSQNRAHNIAPGAPRLVNFGARVNF